MSEVFCSNCDESEPYAQGRCEACYRYFRRTKRERPKKLYDNHFDRRYRRFISKSLTFRFLNIG